MKRALPLSRVYTLIEPGPVVLVASCRRGKPNVMAMSWHMMVDFEPPLIAECYVNLECVLADTRLAKKHNLLIWEVVQAWIDPGRKHPRTIHHMGKGRFMVAGRTVEIESAMP